MTTPPTPSQSSTNGNIDNMITSAPNTQDTAMYMSAPSSPTKSSTRHDDDTIATSVSGGDDTESIFSVGSHHPVAPPPTRAATVAGSTIPDYEYMESRLSTVNMSSPPTSLPEIGYPIAPNDSQTSPVYPEASNWEEDTEESMRGALQALARLAEDEHKVDPGKSVEEYYSERLAKLIREGLIAFDAKALN